MSRRLPPLTAFQAFETAARHLSFTKAAAELHVTKSAVSHQIKALENYLDVKLFHRSPRQLSLTDAGEATFPEAKVGFDRLATALHRLAELESRDVLRVSVSSSFAAKWLVPRLGQFEMLHPDIDVHICAAIDVTDLMRDEVDVVIRYGPNHYPSLLVDRLLDESAFPVVSPTLLNAGALRKPHDLRGYRLIHVDEFEYDDGYPIWASWLDAAGVSDIDPTRGPRFSLMSLAIQTAIEGRGVALVGSALVEDDLAAGRLVRPFEFDCPDVNYPRCMITTEVTAKLSKVEAFRDWLIGQVAVPGESTNMISSTPQSPLVGIVGEKAIESNGGKNQETANRAQVEAVRSGSELPLHSFVAHSPGKMAMLDRDMRYLAASRKWIEAIRGERDIMDRCDDNTFSQPVRDAIRRGLTGVIQQLDEQTQDPQGDTRRVRWTILPTKNAAGEIGGVLLFSDDSAQLIGLETRRHRYDYFGSESRDMIAFVDHAYTYRAVNQAFLEAYGATREDVLGRTVAQLIGETLFKGTLKPILDRCLHGESMNFQGWREYPNWGRRFVHAHFDPIAKGKGAISGVAVDIRDLTALQADSKNDTPERVYYPSRARTPQ